MGVENTRTCSSTSTTRRSRTGGGGVSGGLIGGVIVGVVVLFAAGIGIGVYCAKKKACLQASTATPATAVATSAAVTVEINKADKQTEETL